MKHLKVLAIAAMAAMALMAFGASSASATTLFKDAEKKEAYLKEQPIHATLATGTSATLKNTSGQTIATCLASTAGGKTTTQSGTPLGGPIEKLTFEECSQTTDVLASGLLDIEFTSGTNGTVSGTNNEVTLGIFGVTCTYGTGGAGEGTPLGTLDGGAPAKMTINAVINKTAGGFLCPSTGRWTGEYIVTTPNPLYIGP